MPSGSIDLVQLPMNNLQCKGFSVKPWRGLPKMQNISTSNIYVSSQELSKVNQPNMPENMPSSLFISLGSSLLLSLFFHHAHSYTSHNNEEKWRKSMSEFTPSHKLQRSSQLYIRSDLCWFQMNSSHNNYSSYITSLKLSHRFPNNKLPN